ncbi:MAG: hypothetical protein LBD06_10455 [Candidatus Accumulibacter sp.]|jgi:hypothetical protein|nr:hypothetical protein [Accumulibacter sp.]
MSNGTFVSAFDVFENGKGAADPSRLRALREELFQLARGIRRKLDQGLPASEVAAAKSLLAAAEVAENVVESLSA